MAVLAVPMDKTFEVAVDKVENFDKKAKEHPTQHHLCCAFSTYPEEDVFRNALLLFYRKDVYKRQLLFFVIKGG